MSDLTREQIDLMRRVCVMCQHGNMVQLDAQDVDALCTMALRAIDAADEIETLRAALQARAVDVPAYYTKTATERDADARTHARRITRHEAAWMTFSMRAHHEAQKPRALDTGWQPMSTAPRDGTAILTTGRYPEDARDYNAIAFYSGRGHDDWHAGEWGWKPLAWMPLPPPFTGDPKTLERDDQVIPEALRPLVAAAVAAPRVTDIPAWAAKLASDLASAGEAESTGQVKGGECPPGFSSQASFDGYVALLRAADPAHRVAARLGSGPYDAADECSPCGGTGDLDDGSTCPDCNGTGRAKGGEHGE